MFSYAIKCAALEALGFHFLDAHRLAISTNCRIEYYVPLTWEKNYE